MGGSPVSAVRTTLYAAASLGAGDPVTLRAWARPLSERGAHGPVTLTLTLPVGVVPIGASGAGWTCAEPRGQRVVCTLGHRSSTGVTEPAPVTLDGVVTAAAGSAPVGATAHTAQTVTTARAVASGSTAVAKARGARPGRAGATVAGALPGRPAGISLSSASGPAAGGSLLAVQGRHLGGATALEIGSDAEQRAGAVTTVLPCSGPTRSPAATAARACFTQDRLGLSVSALPAHAPGRVRVTVVTLGVAGSAAYAYQASAAKRPRSSTRPPSTGSGSGDASNRLLSPMAVPSAPAQPTATAGSSSATVTWAPPPSNGSTISGYQITPYKAGTAQTAISVPASPTSYTVTGLTPGSSYTFTVAATSNQGNGSASPQSAAVTPYTTPGAPTIGSVTGGANSAVVNWTAPTSTGGSPITGYVVTPYNGTTAQAPQSFASTATSQTVTGLTSGVVYTFAVAATNAAGTGPQSAKSASITTTGPAPAGEVGAPYSYKFTGNGGTPPYTYSYTGTMPPGLSLNTSTGLISGTPTTVGSFTVTVAVRDAFNTSGSRSITIVINAGPAITGKPPQGDVGVAYSYAMTVTGGTSPYSWSVTAGSLPPGVTLDGSSGRLSGTPTTAGSYSPTVQVTDASGVSASTAVTMVVVAAPLVSGTPTSGEVGVAYSYTMTASGGTSPYAWTVASGSLPGGINLGSSTGTLSGTPTAAGSYSFTVQAADAAGGTATRAVTLVVNAAPAISGTPTSGEVSAAYSYPMTVSGGTAPYTWAVSAGSLPSGISLNSSSGLLSGTPTAAGSFTPTIRVTDASGGVATKSVTITIATGPSVTGTPPTGEVGLAYSYQFAVNGGTAPYSWSLSSGSLPSGLQLSTSGLVSGTPTSSGSYPVTVRVSDANNVAGTAGYTLVVNTAPTVGGTPTSGDVGVAYSYTMTASGGTSPYAWSVSSGSLPPGISLGSSTGTLSGTPTTAGSYSFTVQVSDASAVTATRAVTLVVNATLGINGTPTSGEVSVAYSYSMTAVGGTSPVTWSVSSGSLPAGITLGSSTGVLSGTPTAAGSYSFAVQAADASGGTATRAVTLQVISGPTWDFSAPPSGEVSVPYSTTLAASGGTAPLTWSLSAGSLPAGLTLSSTTGVLSGTPTAAGTSSLTVRVVDANGVAATKTTAVTIAGPPTLTSAPPADPKGVGYSFTFVATGGTAPFTYSVVSGSLPPGMSLSSSGVFSGNPQDQGTWAFTAQVTDAFNQTATDAVRFTVGPAPVTVTKTANTTSAAPGDTVTYTVTMSNTTSNNYPNATLSDPLSDVVDDATYNNDATVTAGNVSYSGSTLTWQNNLGANATVTMTYSVTVARPDTGNKLLTGTVTTGYLSTSCNPGHPETGCSAPVTVSGLSVATTADVSSVSPGGVVHYTTTVTNTGQTAYASAAFSDSLAGVLDDATYNGDATAGAGSAGFSSPNLTWSGALAVGASATVTFSVTVRNPDPGDRSLSQTATSGTSGSTCPTSSPPSSCSSTVQVLVPALTIKSIVDVATTTPSSTVHFTVTATNTGQTDYASATFTDDASGTLDDAALSGALSASVGTLSYPSGTAFTWTGALAKGASVTVSGSVRVNNPDQGDKWLLTRVTSGTAGSNCAAGSSDPGCATGIPVLIPQLTLSTSADATTTTPGSTVHYTVTVSNTGQTSYTGATVSVPLGAVLDDATYAGDASAGSGSVSYGSSALTWTGDLAAGATATITYSVVVSSPDTGDKVLTTAATSAAAGSTCPTGTTATACTSTVQVLIPGLSLTTTSDAGSTTPGGVVHYTLTIANTGQTSYASASATLNLTGATDDATYNGDGSTTGGRLGYGSGVLYWSGALATGASVTVTVSVTVNDPDTGDRSLVVAGTSSAAGSTCPTAGSGSGCSTTVTVLVPQLSVGVTADSATATPGQVVHYTLSVRNTGQTAYPAASVSASLADALTDATYDADVSASAGSASSSGSTIAWTGALAVGDSATVTYSLTIRNPDPGDKSLLTTAVSSSAGSTCPAGSTAAACTSTVTVLVPGLLVTKTADTVTTTPGSTVHYTVTATDTGQTAYASASFSDALAGVLDDAAYGGDASATTGTVGYSGGVVSWTGALAVGASVTLTYSVTVSRPDTGDALLRGAVTSPTPGSNCPSGGTDSRCSTSTAVAQLDMVQAFATSTATPGSVVRLNSTFTNTGAVPYTGITVSMDRYKVTDDAVLNGDQTATSGTISVTPTVISWTGDIPVGGRVVFTRTLTIKNPDNGDRVLSATMVTAASGSNCAAGSTDTRCTSVLNVLLPGVTLSTTADTSTITPGGTVHFTALIANTGQTAYTGATVRDTLAMLGDADYRGDATATSGSLSYSSPVLTWTGDLPVGASVTVTFSVLVHDPDTGNKTMTNAVASDEAGSTCPISPSRTTYPQVVYRIDAGGPLVPANDAGPNWAADTSATSPYHDSNSNATNWGPGETTDSTVPSTTPTAIFDSERWGPGTDQHWAFPMPAGATATVRLYFAERYWPGSGYRSFDVGIDGSTVLSHFDIAAAAGGANVGTMRQFGITSDGTINIDLTHQQDNAIVMGIEILQTSAPAASRACAANVIVLTPALTVTHTADSTSTQAGGSVTYTDVVTNTGQVAYPAAGFSDPLAGILDDASYDGTFTASGGTASYANSTLTWSGALSPGDSVTLSYTVTVRNPDPGDRDLHNTVVSGTSGANCAAGSSDTRCTADVAVAAVQNLTYSVAADVRSAVAGAVVHYTLSIGNSAATTYVGAGVTDDLSGVLDDASYGSDVTSSAGTASLAGSGLAWSGNVPAQGTVTVTFSVTVHTPLDGDKLLASVLSSASLGSNCHVGAAADVRCSSTVTVARVAVSVRWREATALPGSVIHITTIFSNTGTTPYDGITFNTFSPGMFDDALPNGDDTATSGTFSIGEHGPGNEYAMWTGDIPVGGSVTLTSSFTVNDPDTGDHVIPTAWTTTAPGSVCVAGNNDASCGASITVLNPSLTITKTGSATSAVPGDTITYTDVIANTGTAPYPSVSVDDSLSGTVDDATYNADATATAGGMSFSASTLTWTGALAVGDTVTVTYSVTVRSPDPGDKVMVSTVGSSSAGSSCPPGSSAAGCRLATTVLTPRLSIAVAAGPATATPGATVTHTVTVTDSGQTSYPAATFRVALTGALDDAAYDPGGTSASTGSTSYASGVLTWTGALAPGDVARITYAVVVDNPDGAPGDQVVSSAVTSASAGSTCPAGGTDPACSTSVPVAELTVHNGVDVSTTQPTGQVRYTTTFSNTGKVPYTGFTLQDDFRDALDDGRYNGDATASSGNLIFGSDIGQVGILFWKGDLAVGQTVTVTGSFTVKNPDTANRVMRTLVTSDVPGSTCPTGTTAAACTTTVQVLQPALRLSTAVDHAPSHITDVEGYTLTVANTGQTPYTGVTVSDALARVLDDAAFNNDATATAGSVALSGSVLTWTGDLAVGDTVTITFSVTVRDPDLGDMSMVDALSSTALGSTCPPGSAAAGCSTSVLVAVPVLNVHTAANVSTTTPGGVVGYTVTVTNTGNSMAPGALVVDRLDGLLDDATYDGDATATSGAATVSNGSLSWVGDLAVRGTVNITFSVTVLDPDPGDRALVNGAGSPFPGATCPDDRSNPACVTTVAVLLPGVSISTTAGVATATPGDAVHFTTVIANTGQTAYSSLPVATDLTGVLDDASYGGDGTATAGTISASGTTLTWTGQLLVGATVTVTYSAVVHDPDSGDRTLDAAVSSAAPGSSCPVGGTDPRCSASVAVLVPSLALSQQADVITTTPGSTVRYRITVGNDGQTDQPAAQLTDDLSAVLTDAVYDGDVAASSGVVGASGSLVTWTGALGVGARATVTFSVTVRDPDPGDKKMVATLASASRGSSCPVGSTGAACVSTVQVLVPRLTITTAADTATVVAGRAVHYTLTIANSGQTPYLGATVTDSLAAVLDDARYAGGATASTGSVSLGGTSSDRLVWTGDLAVGATATVTFSVTTLLPDPGDRRLVDAVTSGAAGSSCPVASPAASCGSTVGVLVPGLTFASSVDSTNVVSGGTVHYTLTVSNTGQSLYDPASLSVDLSGVLDDAAYRGDALATVGTVRESGTALTWTGQLPVGAMVTITYSVLVDHPDANGDGVVTSVVSSSDPGSQCPTGVAVAACTTTTTVRPPSLTLTDLTSSFTLSGQPDSTVAQDGAVTMTVTTDNPGGYFVTAQAASPELAPDQPGGPGTIAIPRLYVRESGTRAFIPMSASVPVLVHTQDAASAPAGDAVSNDYRVDIPYVQSGTYSGSIDYLVTAP